MKHVHATQAIRRGFFSFCCILLIVFVFIQSPQANAQAMSGTYTLSLPTEKVAQGSEVELTITATAPALINAVELTLTYPSDTLHFERVDTTNSAFATELKNTTTPGTITLARGSVQPVSGEVEVAKILFIAQRGTDIHAFAVVNPTLIASSTTHKNIFSGNVYYQSMGTGSVQTMSHVDVPSRYMSNATNAGGTISNPTVTTLSPAKTEHKDIFV